jgi:hypothetical protein
MKGGALANVGFALVIPILLVLISGAIVLATAFVWQGLGQRELAWQSMLLAWPVAAIVLCAVFIPLVLLDIRRKGPLVELRPGDPPPDASASTTSTAPFFVALAASVIAILVLWTSILGE